MIEILKDKLKPVVRAWLILRAQTYHDKPVNSQRLNQAWTHQRINIHDLKNTFFPIPLLRFEK